MQITVWQADSVGAALQRSSAQLLEPGPDEALLEVLHGGLCHSDLSMIDNSWGVSAYPLVPGHEVVGRVVQVGEGVDPSLVGQLRGLGWISGSCRHCSWCLGGRGEPLRRSRGHRGGPQRGLRQPCEGPSGLADSDS